MAAAVPEPVEPPRVVVHGNTPIARAVMSVAVALGYAAEAYDGAVLEGAAGVVTATHGGPDEAAVLRAALAAGVPYVALVGSRSRGEAVVAGLAMDGLPTDRVHTPAGLDIGARTPEEVALAILAQMVSTRPRVPGQARAARGKAAPPCGGHRGSTSGVAPTQ
jgi:xanthine dehydrogenase accessory factor